MCLKKPWGDLLPWPDPVVCTGCKAALAMELQRAVRHTWKSRTSSNGVSVHVKTVSLPWPKSVYWGLIRTVYLLHFPLIQLMKGLPLCLALRLLVPLPELGGSAALASASCGCVLCLNRFLNWLQDSSCCSKPLLYPTMHLLMMQFPQEWGSTGRKGACEQRCGQGL